MLIFILRITLLGASWEPLGGQDEAKMEPSWAKLGPSWPQVGVKLALGGYWYPGAQRVEHCSDTVIAYML